MLRKSEKRLLAAAFWTAVAAASGLLVAGIAGREQEVRTKSLLLEAQRKKLVAQLANEASLAERRNALAAEVASREARTYARGEIDPYRFGVLVRSRLQAQGLAVERYQPVSAEGRTLLEFSVRGSALGLASFLRDVSSSEKRWSIPALTVTAREQGVVEAVIRVTYETLDDVAP